MPNRIIKESICRSDQINGLTPFEEVLFYRLMVSVDDYGRFDGRTAIIKNTLFPLKDGLSQGQIEDAMFDLECAGLVALYKVDGRPYVRLTGWEKHQSIRAKKSKYPADPDEGNDNLQASASNCKQMKSDASKCPRNPNPIRIQSESESEAENAHTREKRKRFTPPTVEEVDGYCREKGLKVEATTFVNHYDSVGWTVGKSPMRDWRAACRTWSSREQKPAAKPAKTVREQQYSQRDYADGTELPAWMRERLLVQLDGGGCDA